MRGLDTNVLVRYVVRDDPGQFAAAARLLDGAGARGERFVLAPIVLCEFVWVLESAYACSRQDVSHALEQILRTAQFDVLEKDLIWVSWQDYRKGPADFADYYLGRRHQAAGATRTLTFDRALARCPHFETLSRA